ncbi:hypothetical protein [Allomesorhizobium alhagi]|uniref:Uncharacterized protein n=1 Tax=Mesorhizobium alhagi CCNWXJ12-2 TaxID=1107882 RepID=H0HQX9_9HYPH|nr:hypothetical protein [Mesorhizobium alhagi]EHK56841.1 hypothetical protein MAXJ12_12807 [Mesorhizobium alhagi CCNWXJ12-2]
MLKRLCTRLAALVVKKRADPAFRVETYFEDGRFQSRVVEVNT